MLASNLYDHNYLGVSVLGEIFSWPEAAIQVIQAKFEQPYDYLLINFVKPYLSHFKTHSDQTEWLNDPRMRCKMIQHVMWALSNIFADNKLATEAIFNQFCDQHLFDGSTH
jgi:hypothetical protein